MQLSDFYPQMKGWTPAMDEASVAKTPQVPNEQTQVSPYLRTVLPLPLQYSGDTIKQYNRPGISSFRTPPLPPSGIPSINAAAQSTATAAVVQAAAATPVTPTDVEELCVNLQTGTSYTLQSTDRGILVSLSNAAGGTINIPAPANSSSATSVFGQPGFVGGAGVNTSPISATPIDIPAGALIVVCVIWSDSGTSGVTDNVGGGNSYVSAGSAFKYANNFVQFYYVLNSAAKTAAVVSAAFSNTANNYTGIGVWVVPLGGTVVFDTVNLNGTTAASPSQTSGAITTTSTDEMVFAFNCDGGVGDSPPPANIPVSFTSGWTVDSTGYGALAPPFNTRNFYSAAHRLLTAIQSGLKVTSTVGNRQGGGGLPIIAFKGATATPGAPGIPQCWYTYIENTGAGTFNLTLPSIGGFTLDGSTSPLAIGPNQGLILAFNGFNWFTMRGMGGGGGGITSADIQNEAFTYVADTGAANAYAIAPTPVVAAYQAGQFFTFLATNANTTTSTLAVSGLAAKTIKKLGGSANLASGDIAAGSIVTVIYDGTNFQMISAIANAPAGAPVTSVFGRTGAVVAVAGDYGVTLGGTGQTGSTKGDIVVGSGTNTNARLPVGTDTFVLTAKAAATNGVDWEAAPVTSFNGRTGAIIPQSGDYTAGQISGNVDGILHGDPIWAVDSLPVILSDDFFGGTLNGAGTTGNLGWSMFGGTPVSQQGALPHLGILSLPRGTASNGGSILVPGGTVAASASQLQNNMPLLDYPGWKLTWVWKWGYTNSIFDGTSNSASLIKSAFYAGLANTSGVSNPPVTRPNAFIGCRYDTSVGVQGNAAATAGTMQIADTTIKFEAMYNMQPSVTAWNRSNYQGLQILQRPSSVASSGNVTTLAASFAQACRPGSTIIVVCASGSNSAITVTDNSGGGNTYNQDVVKANGTAFQVSIFSSTLSATGATATMTVTMHCGSASAAIQIYEVTSNGTISFDTSQTGSGTGTAVTTPALTAAGQDELIFQGTAVGTAAQTITEAAANGWIVESASINTTTPNGLFSFVASKQQTTLNTSVAGAATLGGSEPWAQCIAAYKTTVSSFFDTGVAPVLGQWYRLELLCVVAGQVKVSLFTNNTTFTHTFTIPQHLWGSLVGSSAAALATGTYGQFQPGLFGNTDLVYLSGGSIVTIAGATSASAVLNGTWTVLEGVKNSALGTGGGFAFYTNTGAFGTPGGVATQGTALAYLAYQPIFMWGCSDEASPLNTFSALVDKFAFVWDTSIATSPLATSANYSRYATGS